MAWLVFLGMAFSFIKLISSSDTLTKREAAILKICPPAIITSAEGRQRGQVVRASDLKSVGRGFKSRSDR